MTATPDDTPCPIVIRPRDRFGNIMFKYMLAETLARRLHRPAEVYGPGLPEWGIPERTNSGPVLRPYVLEGQLFDLDEIAHALDTGLCDGAQIDGWGMRLEFFGPPAAWRARFASDVTGTALDDGEILVNIRAEDIEDGHHSGYYPMPFSWYDAVLERTGKRPVFMGQTGPGAYMDALRARFPDARVLGPGTVLEDFQTIRHARCKVLAVSSFSWLAAWLGDPEAEIHYPVAGMFDPRVAWAMLMPYGDARYRFWDVEFPAPPDRAGTTAAEWAAAPRRAAPVGPVMARRIAAFGLTKRYPVSAVAALRARFGGGGRPPPSA